MSAQFWFLLLFPGLPILALVTHCRKLTKARQEASRPFDEMRRLPAYSLSQRADERWEGFTTWLSVTMFVAVVPWLIFTLTDGRLLIASLIFGFASSAFCFRRMLAAYHPLPSWWLGIRGEQQVGAELDAIQSSDVKVFHDLEISDPNGDWNIDHVVVTRAGLFAVETKAKRKKQSVESPRYKLSFDGHKVNFPDGSYDVDSIKQASRQARWLKQQAEDWCGGVEIPVVPILTFPGWWVDATGKGEVVVLNPKQISRFVADRRPTLDDRSWKILLSQLKSMTVVKLEVEPKSQKQSQNRRNDGVGSRAGKAVKGKSGR